MEDWTDCQIAFQRAEGFFDLHQLFAIHVVRTAPARLSRLADLIEQHQLGTITAPTTLVKTLDPTAQTLGITQVNTNFNNTGTYTKTLTFTLSTTTP